MGSWGSGELGSWDMLGSCGVGEPEIGDGELGVGELGSWGCWGCGELGVGRWRVGELGMWGAGEGVRPRRVWELVIAI